MNGHVCCILGVCCPPGSAEQMDALAKELTKGAGTDHAQSKAVAALILEHFDLAPKGTVTPLLRAAHALKGSTGE